MNKKTFIILLVILVLAYAVSAGRGFFHENDDSEITKDNIEEKMDEGEFPPAWLDGMGSLVAKRIGADDIQAVRFEDPDEGSYDREQGRIVFTADGAECTLTFKPSSFFKTRSLVLELVDRKASVDVTAPSTDEEGREEQKTLPLPTDKGKTELICAVTDNDKVIITCTGLVEDPKRRNGDDTAEICKVRIGE